MSADINSLFLSGRLARDPELNYTGNGTPYCKFDLAVDKRVKRGDEWTNETIFFNRITLWRGQAEVFHRYVKQGDQIFLEGSLDMDEWEQEGQKRRKVQINVRSFRFGAKKGGGSYDGPASPPPRREAPPRQSSPPPSRPTQAPPADYEPDTDINDDDIPF